MTKKEKLKTLLDRLEKLQKLPVSNIDEDINALASRVYKEEAEKISQKLGTDPILKALNKLSKELDKVKTEFNFTGILELIKEIQSDTSTEELGKKLDGLAASLQTLDSIRKSDVNSFAKGLSGIKDYFDTSLKNFTTSLQKEIGSVSESSKVYEGNLLKTAQDLEEAIKKLRKEILQRISNIGGGNANRNIAIGGNTSVLSTYTDINLKAGSNVTITYSKNNNTKYTDITIASSGGGGSVGGTVRSINNITTSQTAGSDSGTDYVYIASAGIALTLPTAAGNTNQYTLKNTSNSSVVLIPDGAETIDSASNAILTFKYTSVDVISDGTSNWNIT